ncbi:MAG: MBL fold metallo-hydrolase [Actinomycetota bacterium]|nr:MBL fold metallo-hydrolase [Actinomycetota bacterium]
MSEPLSLTVLGCDGSYPGPGGSCSGYLLRCGGTTVLLDAGPGTLARLQEHLAITDLDAVVVSHEHVDHWSDLEHLAVACHYIIQRPPVPLYCEADLVARMRVGPAAAALTWVRVDPGARVDVGAMTFTFSRTDHTVDTLAVRVDGGGRSLGYSADSGPAWGLEHLGAGLDLALCEATFLSDREGSLSHLSGRQAGTSAHAAGVKRLVLTHQLPGVDRQAVLAEAEAAFGGPAELATVGRRYLV